MALLEWRAEFETGIADVDFEHRELIDLINDLHGELGSDAPRDRIGAFLGEVFARISAHFALEESVMRKHDYDQYDDHKREHEQLLDDIRDIMDNFNAGKYLAYDDALATAVSDWFIDHFKTKDARLHGMLGV
jgi:hemerythrin